MNIHTFLLVLALVFAVLAGLKCPEPRYLSFGWMSVAILVLTLIFGGVRF